MVIGTWLQTPCFRVLTSRQKVHNQAVSALAYDPVGKHLISASKDGAVIVWDEWANPVQQYAQSHLLAPFHNFYGCRCMQNICS